MQKRAFICLISIVTGALLFFVGCASNQIEMENLNVPLVELQVAAHQNLPAGTLRVSPNGREFFSNYFITTTGGSFVKAKYPLKRYQAHVLVLGDRRPYNVIVRVNVQIRGSDGNYEIDHLNKGIARVISRRIQTTLHERLEHRNFIDDFRAF